MAAGERTAPDGYVVQVKLGEAVVGAIRDFASSEVPRVEELEADMFKHVRDPKLRRSLAETFHGARWLYHLGLVTLATDAHRAAHIRAQIIDYAAPAATEGSECHLRAFSLWRSCQSSRTDERGANYPAAPGCTESAGSWRPSTHRRYSEKFTASPSVNCRSWGVEGADGLRLDVVTLRRSEAGTHFVTLRTLVRLHSAFQRGLSSTLPRCRSPVGPDGPGVNEPVSFAARL